MAEKLQNTLNHDSHEHARDASRPALPFEDLTEPYLRVRMVLKDRCSINRYSAFSIDVKNQGESLFTRLQELRQPPSASLQMRAKILDLLNMRQDSIWLVNVSLVGLKN